MRSSFYWGFYSGIVFYCENYWVWYSDAFLAAKRVF